jgi:MAF protein
MRLVLASQSPRRRELLERAGFSFTVSTSQISEILDENLNLAARIEDLAVRKAEAWIQGRNPSELRDVLVLSADTVVALGDIVLGKPRDSEENLSFLRRMSSREHVVITAVCLVKAATGELAVGHGLTRLRFRHLGEDEMRAYVESGDGLDKAGGYGIQGAAGKFVDHMEGDFDNVMGLPISVVHSLLASKGWSVDGAHSNSNGAAAAKATTGEVIARNLQQVRERIAAACARAGRAPSDVRLVAVSKTKPVELIREAIAAGQNVFGENYVQEAVDKINQFPRAEWHFIGSLQTNKAKQVAGRFALVHSVDRLKLASALDAALEKTTVTEIETVQPILLQVHVGDESTKHGFSFEELPQAAKEISQMKHLSIRGLMALPPLEDSEEKSRVHFAKLREALEIVKAQLPPEQRGLVRELSMGTSGDLEAAILEGATLVRVGTDIFGARS